MKENEKTILFELFESAFGAINAARIVSSLKEAWDIYKGGDELDTRYNRFPLVYMIFDEDTTAFWFRLYINLCDEEIYIFYEKPSNTKLYFYDSKEVFACMKVIKLSKAKSALMAYLSIDFLGYINSLLTGSTFSLDRATYMSTMIKNSEAEALLTFSNSRLILDEKMLWLPGELLKSTRALGSEKNQYKDISDYLVTEIKLMENPESLFSYLVCGSYIWLIKKEKLDEFKRNLLNRKIIFFLED